MKIALIAMSGVRGVRAYNEEPTALGMTMPGCMERGAVIASFPSPLPRFDLLNPDEYNRVTVQTQRGCPWRCNFCASSIMMTKRYKLKPVENVIREIRAIKEIRLRPFIEFADDNSFVNRSHSKKLLLVLADEGVKWFTETDVAVADAPELLDLMRESGCAEVLIDFEGPTAASLDGVDLKTTGSGSASTLLGGHPLHPVPRHRGQRLLRAGEGR